MPANVEEVAGRRWRLALRIALLVAALAGVWWGVAGFELGPFYQGRSAMEWLDGANQPPPDGPQAQAAFRAMGPKGVRFLARWVAAKPFELPERVDRFFRDHNFPKWADLTKITDERQEVLGERQSKAIDPERLRAIAQRLNEHQDEALRDLLKLLESTNATDQINAMMGMRFLGAPAAIATPRLAELATHIVPSKNAMEASRRGQPNPMEASRHRQSATLACAVLGDLGPKAAAAIPALRADLATNGDKQMAAAAIRGSRAALREMANKQMRMVVAQALALIDPGDTNAAKIAREKDKVYLGLRGSPVADALASYSLWKLGGTNPPVNQLVSAGRKTGYQYVVEQLSDIGPLATNALPFLEECLDPLNPQSDLALAIQKIDPKEAERLGLPGLLIVCPDKY
ncbi:MAG: hypothetical protein ACLQVY_09850 [Limisphaerales bacterium]